MQKEYMDELYEELVSRIDHIDRAFIVRRHIKLHYAKSMPNEVSSEYLKVRKEFSEFFGANEEALLWFITIELWSRFTANSKRGIRSLIHGINDKQLIADYSSFKTSNKELFGYISTQRSQYFGHADDVSWKDFPSIGDKEYEKIINEIKELLRGIAKVINNQRMPNHNQKFAEMHTDKLFNALLSHVSPSTDVSVASKRFNEGLNNFLEK